MVLFFLQLILQLKQDCNDLTEEELSKLGVNLLNCQSALEGRKVYPCTSSMVLDNWFYLIKKNFSFSKP